MGVMSSLSCRQEVLYAVRVSRGVISLRACTCQLLYRLLHGVDAGRNKVQTLALCVECIEHRKQRLQMMGVHKLVGRIAGGECAQAGR
jgi:hypothetical protein